MKFYKGISRYKFNQTIDRSFKKHILWALSLQPGDLINDCTTYNREVVSVHPDFWFFKKNNNGYCIYDVIIDMTGGGSCSLRHCGVEKGLSREVIETRRVQDIARYLEQLTYLSVKDRALLEKELDYLRKGGHTCDERGIYLTNQERD